MARPPSPSKSAPARPAAKPSKAPRKSVPKPARKVARKVARNPKRSPAAPAPSRREMRLNAGRDADLNHIWPGLLERARQLLRKEREASLPDDPDGPARGGRVGTVELVLSGLRRQKRKSQGWSAIGWMNTDHAHAATYSAMQRALRDKGRSRARRPDNVEAGDLTSEFLAPLMEAGVLNPGDLGKDSPQLREMDDFLRRHLADLEKSRPDLAVVLLLVGHQGRTTEEVGRHLGITSRAVRKRLVSVRPALAALLVDAFPDLRPRLDRFRKS